MCRPRPPHTSSERVRRFCCGQVDARRPTLSCVASSSVHGQQRRRRRRFACNNKKDRAAELAKTKSHTLSSHCHRFERNFKCFATFLRTTNECKYISTINIYIRKYVYVWTRRRYMRKGSPSRAGRRIIIITTYTHNLTLFGSLLSQFSQRLLLLLSRPVPSPPPARALFIENNYYYMKMAKADSEKPPHQQRH